MRGNKDKKTACFCKELQSSYICPATGNGFFADDDVFEKGMVYERFLQKKNAWF